MTVLAIGDYKHEMPIEHLKCRANLNFVVDFRVNGAIDTIATKWDPILFRKWIGFTHNIIFSNGINMPSNYPTKSNYLNTGDRVSCKYSI